VNGMLPDTWWWPWWVSSLIDVAVVIAALVAFRFSRRRAVRAFAAVLVAVGLVAAALAPVVMTDQSDQHMRNEPAMRGGPR
jgi:choline-glycine betaine transporter